MRLKKLEIHGFKSFADRTEMTFDGGITGIVGPNGCGKSNISDAVRWVLGEQSAKTLRGGKMEDVIFGGTEKRRRLSLSEVTLTIENEDRALPIDFAEVSITRRVYRDGDSEYQINGAPCRLRDVVDLFRDTGIGREGYSLIGQGRIDEILSGKSDDRRRAFEEAAGIVKYKARKTEAEKRIQNMRQNLERVDDILRELSARLEPLAAQSEAAREFIALRDELKKLDLNAFLVRSDRLSERTTELTSSYESLAQSLSEATARQQALTEARERAQQELEGFEREAAESREQVQTLIRDVESREGTAGVLRERIASGERDYARLVDQAEAAREGDAGVAARLSQLTARIEAEVRSLSGATSEKQAGEAALSAREKADAEAEAKIETLKAELIEAMNRLSDVRSESARLTAMRSALAVQIEKLETGQDSDLTAEARLRDVQQSAAERLESEQAQKAQLDEETAGSAQRVRESVERYEETTARLASLTTERQQTASRLGVLEEMQRDYEGYQHSVKNVLLQARRSPDSGVRGVVATLIRVPEQLERALDMALGGALQNIVVDREEDAKRMIDYLRVNRLGRATFLPLSAVRGRTLDANERRLMTMSGCLGVASELIQYDPVYRGVVENLLGRTVVAKDLDAGIQIMRAGHHAFRLVTLEGDVMNPGGSMTGGSVQSRMTSLLTREREVDDHKARITRLDGEIAALKRTVETLEAERAELKRARGLLFERLHQQEIAVAREEAHLAAAQAELAAHVKRAKVADEERGKLREQLADVEAALGRIDGREGGEEKVGAQKREQIASLQKSLVRDRQETQALRQKVLERSVKLAAQSRGLDALKADRDRMTMERGDLNKLLLGSEDEKAACETRLASDRDALKAAEAALSDAKTELGTVRQDFDLRDRARTGAQKALERLMDEADSLRVEAEELTDKCHRAEMQKSRVEAEWKQLTDRVWEDYELTYEGAGAFREADFKLGEADKRISEIRTRIRAMGAVNVSAVDEYRETKTRHDELNAQREDLLKAEGDLAGIISELTGRMEKQFTEQFEFLNRFFQQTFVRLFGGGRAHLRLEDPSDPLNCDIEVAAQPPGKKLTLLSLLSGGERALTAIAILFAMLELKPTPFCFLDEIEAALDDANIDNFADYLRDYSMGTQFVVVTHRKGTMERCDSLYGVSMEEKGISRMVSLKLSKSDGRQAAVQKGRVSLGLFDRIKQSMGKTRANVSGKIDQLVDSSPVIDETFFEDLTDILIMADVGVKTSEMIIQKLRDKVKTDGIKTTGPAREALKMIVVDIMGSEPMRLQSPMVVPVIGVNGVGKTTSIGKLASRMKTVGRNVVICAGDTFRAAAADQLTVWAERAGVPLVKHHEGADAAAVVFDAVQLAKSRHADVLIIDTAGRLHNKAYLMEELKKISRVVEREFPEAIVKGLLVIDATTGQNGLQQAQVFKDAAILDGIILTKLDGTAKGGIALAIRGELGLPVRYIGIGEALDDLEPFDAKAFVDAIF